MYHRKNKLMMLFLCCGIAESCNLKNTNHLLSNTKFLNRAVAKNVCAIHIAYSLKEINI